MHQKFKIITYNECIKETGEKDKMNQSTATQAETEEQKGNTKIETQIPKDHLYARNKNAFFETAMNGTIHYQKNNTEKTILQKAFGECAP